MRKVSVALTTLLALTGCAGPFAGTAGGGLLEAMGEVSGDGPAAAYFEYGEPAWWRDFGIDPSPKANSGAARRWAVALGSGMSSLATSSPAMPEATGITPASSTRAIAIGVPPEQAFRFDGDVDADAVRTKLTALGAKPRELAGHEGLSFAPGNEIDPARSIVPGVTNQLNQVVVTGDLVATAAVPESLAAVLGGESSLADRPGHAAVADCLGDVVAATIMTPSAPGAVALYGVGLRRPAEQADRAVNVICVLPAAAAVSGVEQALTTRLTPAGKVRDGGTYGKYAPEIAHDRVDAGDHTVLRAVLTLSDTTHVMFTTRMLYQGELDSLTAASG